MQIYSQSRVFKKILSDRNYLDNRNTIISADLNHTFRPKHTSGLVKELSFVDIFTLTYTHNNV